MPGHKQETFSSGRHASTRELCHQTNNQSNAWWTNQSKATQNFSGQLFAYSGRGYFHECHVIIIIIITAIYMAP